MKLESFSGELKRRNVYKVAVAYLVVAWLLIQVATQVFPFFEIPNWAVRLVVLLLILGFPIALVLAWAFELTPEGIKRADEVVPGESITRRTARKLVGITVALALIAAGLLALQFLHPKSPLTAATSTTATASIAASVEKSIAVLPFENLSEEKANAYFADGVQDEILTRLSKIADLKVISRTSTQKYKSTPTNLREIAQQLGVSNVLEGSVQKAGDQVRVSVQLINALSDSHIWAETYDQKLIDIFQMESDVAQKIASSLEAKLTGREKKDISAAAGTKIPEAYDAYLHALALVNKQGPEELEKLIGFCRRAIELDPNFGQAWACLGIAESQKYFFPDHSPEQLARSRTAAETALRLGPDVAEAHGAMGMFYYYCLRDYDRALRELNVARERTPNNANVLLAIGLVQRRQGKFDSSIELQQQASRLDPLNEDVWVNLGRSFRGLRKFDEARAMFDRALTIAPDDVEIIGQKAETYLAQGDLETSWRLVKDLKFSPTSRGLGGYLTLIIYQRRYDDALVAGTALLTKEKELPRAFVGAIQLTLGNLHRIKGDRSKAQSFFLQAEKILKQMRAEGDTGLLVADILLQVEARLGHRDEVQQLADSNLREIQNDKWQFPLEEEAVARAYTIIGDFDRALPYLQRALTTPSVEALTPAYLRFDLDWDSVRNDPRFQKLDASLAPKEAVGNAK